MSSDGSSSQNSGIRLITTLVGQSCLIAVYPIPLRHHFDASLVRQFSLGVPGLTCRSILLAFDKTAPCGGYLCQAAVEQNMHSVTGVLSQQCADLKTACTR
jgi:hypothetical protein